MLLLKKTMVPLLVHDYAQRLKKLLSYNANGNSSTKRKRLLPLLLTVGWTPSFADEMYDTASKQCFSLIKDQWPTKRIYLNTHDRIGFSGDHRYFMSGRCFEPVCTEPFSWFVYQVRYIEGRKAYITCTMKDAGEPELDLYNDQNRFMPPG